MRGDGLSTKCGRCDVELSPERAWRERQADHEPPLCGKCEDDIKGEQLKLDME